MNKEKSDYYMQIFLKTLESYNPAEESLISHLAYILTEHKILVEDYATWVVDNHDILSSLKYSAHKFKMLEFWKTFETTSVSIEDIF